MVRIQRLGSVWVCLTLSLFFGLVSLCPAADYPDNVSEVSDVAEVNDYAAADCPCNSCGQAQCCCSPCACYCPRWTVEAGAIFFSRDRADTPPSSKVYGSATGQSTPTVVFDMAYSDVGTAVGPDLVLTRHLGPCWDLECRYFQMDGWSKFQQIDHYARTYVSAYGTTVDTQSPSFSYSSRLYNVELNLRWNHSYRMPVMMGFRTLGLDERFQIVSNGNLGTSWAETTTSNGLYGLQLGAEPVLWDRGGRLRIDGIIKAGVYGNSARQRTRFPTAESELASSTTDSPSFVGELGLIGTWEYNKYWSVRAGYEVLWITNVALAPDQASSVTYGATPTGTMDDKAIAFYYGGTVRLERRF